MTEYFDEKSTQVDPEALNAFGIEISSRYGKAHEIVEMINFARIAALENLHGYIEKIFYDSKADICTFDLCPSVTPSSDVALALQNIARKTIGQFDWFGMVDHGEPLNRSEFGAENVDDI